MVRANVFRVKFWVNHTLGQHQSTSCGCNEHQEHKLEKYPSVHNSSDENRGCLIKVRALSYVTLHVTASHHMTRLGNTSETMR